MTPNPKQKVNRLPRLNEKSGLPERLPDTFNFQEFWRTLRRRQLIIWTFTGLVFLLALIYCFLATRRYTATGTVELRRTSRDSLGLDTSLGVSVPGTGDSLAINIESQTQAGILQSDAFAMRVIEELHLDNSPDFKGGFNPIGSVLHLFSPKVPAGAPRPSRTARVVPAFEGNLKVTPTPGTRLIEVTYKSKDPQTAKAVVDRLILDLVNYSTDTQREASSDSSRFIEDQLTAIRKRTEALQDQVAKMQQESGIVALGTMSADGREQAYSVILDELQQIGTTLGQAQTNRILKGAVYDEIRTGNPETISISSGSLSSAGAPGLAASLQTIQNLRVLMTTDEAALAQMEAKFGSGYPRLAELQQQIAIYNQQIQAETGRIRERARNDYEVAVRTEQDARDTYGKLKAKADAINSSAMNFAIAKEEAESSRKLYEDLLSRSKEAEILQGLKPSNVDIVSPAMLPSNPSSPRTPLILAASLFLGLTVGTGLALLFDLFGKRLASVAAIMDTTGRTPLAILPSLTRAESRELSENRGLAMNGNARSGFLDELRFLANSLFLSRTASAPNLVMITSPGALEGKTTVTVNLAVLLTQQGKTVLVIDADLRNPGVHTAFGLGSAPGLADLLSSASDIPDTVIHAMADQPGLFILTTGDATYQSPDLFNLPRFGQLLARLKQNFDCILVDAAPVLTANDAIPIAGQADRVLLVVKLNQTESQALRDAQARLEQFVPLEDLKLVVNGTATSSRFSRFDIAGGAA